MKNNSRLPRALAAASLAASLGAAGLADAATTAAALPVTASIPTTCSAMAGTSMAFGTLASSLTVAQTDTTGTFTVNCTSGGAYSIYSDSGANASGSQKRMQKAATGAYLNYAMFSDSGRSTAFPVTAGTAVSGSGTGAAQTVTIYGRLTGQTATAAGSYSDSVTFTVTY